MHFTYSESDQLLRRAIRDFSVRELEPGARERDAAESFDAALYRKVGDLGLTGLGIAPERDGGGGGLLQTAIATEELARFDPSMSLTLLASLSLATIGIERFGTGAQKDRYVPPLARGEAVGAFCLTEPNAGSDAASGSTHAKRPRTAATSSTGPRPISPTATWPIPSSSSPPPSRGRAPRAWSA